MNGCYFSKMSGPMEITVQLLSGFTLLRLEEKETSGKFPADNDSKSASL